MEEDQNLNAAALMKAGAQIQKFFEILLEHRDEVKSWNPQDEKETELKQSREELIYSLMDDYCVIFDNILS